MCHRFTIESSKFLLVENIDVCFVRFECVWTERGKKKDCCYMFSCVHAATRDIHFENVRLY